MGRQPKQSILVYFFGMSVSILLILIIFSSIALQHLYQSYTKANRSQQQLALCRSVFQVVRHYGFERGRVNVVLNYNGPVTDMARSVSFINTQKEKGEEFLARVTEAIEGLPPELQPANLNEVEVTHQYMAHLRERYLEQLAKPFSNRDRQFDDLWFNTMSQIIRQLNYLLFNISNSNFWLPEQQHLADIYYLLGQLRDHAGPVVSYLKAASFNPQSLSADRLLEITFRREQIVYLLNEILFIGQTALDADNVEQLNDFKNSYLFGFYPKAEAYIAALKETPEAFLRAGFLAEGVAELEKLNSISENLVAVYDQFSRRASLEQGRHFYIGLYASAILFILIIVSLYLAYKSFYQRIIEQTVLLEKISDGDFNVTFKESGRNDEIDLLHSGIKRFRDNLVALNSANCDLLEQIEKRCLSEEKLRLLSDERGLLLTELHHRVKNNMQVILSMMSLQIRRSSNEDVCLALSEAQRRVKNISIAHQMLNSSTNLSLIKSATFFEAIINNMMDIYNHDGCLETHFKLDDFSLSFETAKTLSLILGEALANIYKYAFPDQQSGRIDIRLTKDDAYITLVIKDNGVGFDPHQVEGGSLGLVLMKTFAQTLQGEVAYHHDNGTEITIKVKDV